MWNKGFDVYPEDNSKVGHGTVVSAFAFKDGIFSFADSRITTINHNDNTQTTNDYSGTKLLPITPSICALIAGDIDYAESIVCTTQIDLKDKSCSLVDVELYLKDVICPVTKAKLANKKRVFRPRDFVQILFVGGQPTEEKSAFVFEIMLSPQFSSSTLWMRNKEERRNNTPGKLSWLCFGTGAQAAKQIYYKHEEKYGPMCDQSLSFATQTFFIMANRTCLWKNCVGGPISIFVSGHEENANSRPGFGRNFFSPFQVQLRDRDIFGQVLLLRQRVTDRPPKQNILDILQQRDDVYAVTKFSEGRSGLTIYFRIYTKNEDIYNEILAYFREKGGELRFTVIGGLRFTVIGELPEFYDTAIAPCNELFLKNMEDLMKSE